MKKTIKILIFSIFSSVLLAQSPLDVRIEIFEPYPVELEYYLQNADNLFITVTNVTGIEQKIYYHVRLIGNNGVDINTLPNVKPMEGISILPNYTKFYSSTELEQDFPFDYPEDVDISSLTMDQFDYISFNRALPEGTYKLCITAIDYDTDIPLTFDCSDEFSVSYGDVPFIYDPPHEEIMEVTQSNIFNIAWEPPFTLSPPPGTFTYDLKMIDITEYPYTDLQLLMDNPGGILVFEEWDLASEIYPYDFLANVPLEEGHEYALRVQAKDLAGTYNLSNNGYSEVSTFWYGYDPNDAGGDDDGNGISEEASDCLQNCYYIDNMIRNPTSNVSSFAAIDIGKFTIEEISWTSTTGGNASGSGVIPIPFLNDVKVDVTFAGLEINANGRVYSGIVEADIDQVYDPSQIIYSVAESMNNFIRNGRVVNALTGGSSIGMPLGMMQNIAGYNLLFGFTQMEFTPERASCTLMHNLHMPQFGDEGWISMAGSDICLTPAGFANEYILHPVNDITLPYQGDMTFLFNGSTSQDTATIKDEAFYIQGNCNGLIELAVRGEVHFPESTLVRENADGEIEDGKVVGSFFTRYTRDVGASENVYTTFGDEGIPESSGFHFLALADVEPFQVAGIAGWGFETNQIWIDISDYENPPNINWPDSYDDANINIDGNGDASMGNTWTGVYIENLDIKPPKELLNSNNREGFSLNHMIIDPLITVTVAVEDLIGKGEGGVDGWSLTMDSLFMTIVQNRLESGGFSGELGIPLTEEGEYFRYTALIEDSNTSNTSLDPPSYIFSVQPSDEISFPFLVARAFLSENSYVMGKFTPGNDQQTYFETWLEGGIGISSSLFTPEDDNANIPLELPVVDFQLVYHSQNGISESHFGFAGELEPWESEAGGAIEYDNTFGLQFSEESFGGFPLNILEAGIMPGSTNWVNFSITPSVSIAGDEGGIAGDVGITFESVMEESNGEMKLKLKNFGVTALRIEADVHGLYLDGSIEFYNTMGSDQVGEKGARGDIKVMLPMGTGVQLAAEFGTKKTDPEAAFGTAENFNYWYIDGMAYFAPAGIPIPPIAGIYGLGGGIFINMSKGVDTFSKSEVSEMLDEVNNQASASEGTNDVVRTGGLPSPDFGSYGVKLAATLGTLPTETLLNMDVSVYGSFSKNQGINHLNISGDAYMFTPLSMRNRSSFFANASLDWVKVDDGDQEFTGTLDVFVNTDPIYGNPKDENAMIRKAGFYTSTKSGEWYMRVGEPDQRGELNVYLNPFLTAKASGYMMAGYGLPTDLPIPQRVAWLLDNAKTGDDGNTLDNEKPVSKKPAKRSSGDILMSSVGNGVAFGAEFSATAAIDAYLLYASLSVFVGFDINLTQSSARTCFILGQGDFAPGINDWYALGQVYAGLEGEMGIRFSFKGKNFDLALFEMGAAMMLSGGGPNPTWVEGRAGVYYKILNGAVKGYKKFDITLGEKCVPAYDDPFGDLEIVYETYPVHDEKDVSPLVDPMVSFVLPINEEFSLPSYDADGNPKDIELKLEVEHFHVRKRNGSLMTILDESWTGAKTQVTLDFDEPAAERAWYDADVKVIAYEKKNGNWVRLKDDDGDNWSEVREWSFKTGELPYPIPDDELYTTIPIRRQRYVLQDEVLLNIGKIQFKKDMKNDEAGYFPEDDDVWDYSYYVRYQDFEGGEPTVYELPFVEASGSVETILTTFPELSNATIYSCQLIRKKVRKTNNPFPVGEQIVKVYARDDTKESDMMSTTEVDVTGLSLDPGKSLATNEDLIYQYYFRTSKFDNAQEKLASVTVDYELINESVAKNTYPDVHVYADEDFDVFDVKGEVDGTTVITSPRFKFFAKEESSSGSNFHVGIKATSSSPIGGSSNQPGYVATDAFTGMGGFFMNVRKRWQDYYDLASPFWEESNKSGWCCGTHDIAHSHMIEYGGAPQYSNLTVTEQIYAPPLDAYEFGFDYASDELELQMNQTIKGYRAALSDTEIESAWESYLNQSGNTNVKVSDLITGGGKNINGGNFSSAVNQAGFSAAANEIPGYTGSNAGPVAGNGGYNWTSSPIVMSGNDKAGSSVIAGSGSGSSTGSMVVVDVEIIESPEPKITVPYQLFTKAETDAFQLWNYGYSTYTEMKMYRFTFSVPIVGSSKKLTLYSSAEKQVWNGLIRAEYPAFKDAYFAMENREAYHMNQNAGLYKLTIESNAGFNAFHVSGTGKKKLDFQL